MGSDADAQKAINELNDYQLGGRGLTVNEARPKLSTGRGPDGGGPRRRSEPRW
jgi:RNA recognition motif-containing protein